LPNEVYFNTAPVLNDNVMLNVGQTIMTKGVNIPVGQSKTVELDLYSDGPTSGPWSITAKDFATLQGGSAELGFTFDKTSGVNGDKLHMTIHVISQSQFGVEGFLLINKLAGQSSLWVGLVGNQ
jgi:hypothetical protein